MKLFRRGESSTTDAIADTPADAEGGSTATTTKTTQTATPGKGRPTPKRRDAEGKRRGPVAPAPLTAKEARARRKANRGNKEERKAAAAERRLATQERRARMLAGEDKYLLPRDKGPVRAYVRDLVDARRNLVGLFMPMALVLIMSMFAAPGLQSLVTLIMLVMMLFMAVEGVILGRIVNNRVRERYPDTTDTGFRLGWYAFVRASQIRKMRAPKPRVKPGEAV
ncbi:DUF3043 domain-containing protein [Nocardia puris]|uniref:DUF3043 family protein n=1 Tax=Nocardia puris TaxID=208602 RepID=A0A366DJQ3_9NOCA|nr:DUF3043 domain-containing protein [Nocardia puris]MBF6213009.1 DUF3043 domain-containing protein [Nocardia puris]MBF6368000.1 DUF3043 domain-containing protein [Nocardia puris]MBF6462633.1 DUF3043 domain-containing protein [Nocardia puris]RBO90256.1 DUF3043 family protein [Nocardia puris]